NGSIAASGNTATRGISAGTDVSVTNFGTISVGDNVGGVSGAGVLAQGTATVDNRNTINVGSNSFGVASNRLNNLGVKLTNSGTISAGFGGAGVVRNPTADITNAGSGTISGGLYGVFSGTSAHVKNNAGTIEAKDANGRAIIAPTVNVEKNTGAIRATN